MWKAAKIAFKLIKSKMVVIALAVFSFSLLFSVTSMGLLGVYEGMTMGASGGSECIIVYDSKSSTPLSGIIPLSCVSLLENLSLPLSPELLVPCLIDRHVVIVRGVVPSCFYNVSDLKIMEGRPLLDGDLKSALVGLHVADALNIGVGDRLLVRSIIADAYVELEVKGIFESKEPLNSEIIVPLHVGQWLRGSGYGSITLIRIKANGLEDEVNSYLSKLFKDGEGQAIEANRPESIYKAYPWIEAGHSRASLSSLVAKEFVERYLNKYGLSMDGLIALSAIVALISGVCVHVALSIAFHANKFEIEVLKALGARIKCIRLGFMLKSLSIAMPSAIAGFFTARMLIYLAGSWRLLAIFSYPINASPNLLLLPIVIASTALIVALSSLRLDV